MGSSLRENHHGSSRLPTAKLPSAQPSHHERPRGWAEVGLERIRLILDHWKIQRSQIYVNLCTAAYKIRIYIIYIYIYMYILYIHIYIACMCMFKIQPIYIYIYTTHTLQPALLFQSSHGVICKKVILPPQNDTNQLV